MSITALARAEGAADAAKDEFMQQIRQGAVGEDLTPYAAKLIRTNVNRSRVEREALQFDTSSFSELTIGGLREITAARRLEEITRLQGILPELAEEAQNEIEANS